MLGQDQRLRRLLWPHNRMRLQAPGAFGRRRFQRNAIAHDSIVIGAGEPSLSPV